jgi:hypothetical protein
VRQARLVAASEWLGVLSSWLGRLRRGVARRGRHGGACKGLIRLGLVRPVRVGHGVATQAAKSGPGVARREVMRPVWLGRHHLIRLDLAMSEGSGHGKAGEAGQDRTGKDKI